MNVNSQNINALVNDMLGERGKRPGPSRAGRVWNGTKWVAGGLVGLGRAGMRKFESLEQKKFRLQAQINALNKKTQRTENENRLLVNLKTEMIGLQEAPSSGPLKMLGRLFESKKAELGRVQQEIKNLEKLPNGSGKTQGLQNAKAKEAGLKREIAAIQNQAAYNFSNQAKAYNSIRRYQRLLSPSQAQRNAFIRGVLQLNGSSNRETLKLIHQEIKNAKIKSIVNTKLGYSSSSSLGGLERLFGSSSSSSNRGQNLERLIKYGAPAVLGALGGRSGVRAPAAAPIIVPGGSGGAVPFAQPPVQVSVKVAPPAPTQNQRTLVANAGGPEAIRVASNALRQTNGNVPRAMNNTGLPRETFENVKKLGGVNTAPRIAMAVAKTRRRRQPTVIHRRRHRVVSRKKKTTPPRACPLVKSNRIKKVLHKIPRKTLENFVASWALRR